MWHHERSLLLDVIHGNRTFFYSCYLVEPLSAYCRMGVVMALDGNNMYESPPLPPLPDT